MALMEVGEMGKRINGEMDKKKWTEKDRKFWGSLSVAKGHYFGEAGLSTHRFSFSLSSLSLDFSSSSPFSSSTFWSSLGGPSGDGVSRSPFEHVLFVDGAAVANSVRDLDFQWGVGTGLRYNSPVGALQLDLAYGLAVKRFRIHLNVGFTF